MNLKTLTLALEPIRQAGSLDIDVSHVCFDSRMAGPGSLFVAQKGTKSDGHAYLEDVVAKGAVAIVCEQLPATLHQGVTYLQVADSNKALGLLACAWYGHPSTKLTLVGVTGTNGKTTIASLLYELFMKLGHQSGLLSTVCNYINDTQLKATHTTPDALAINELLAAMVDAGCTHAFMEVSSHAIDQQRIAGLQFAGGIFTNITRDHLDYHLTFDNYLKAKKGFFDALPSTAFALINADDKNGRIMVQNCKATIKDYSTQRMADFKAKVLENHFEGMQLSINQREVAVQFIGRFNVSNLLAIFGTACMLGEDPETILLVLSTLKPVSGRLEFLRSPSGFLSIVDYAHTPDALKNVLITLNELVEGQGRIITVVGAGGNRDKGKRPLMAKEALAGSQLVILTSDNPRYEDPMAILADMQEGVGVVDRKRVLSLVDRKEAIRTACMMAKPGDVVLVAGKGHEDYQDIQGVKHPFDDKQVIADIYTTL
ncbi:MAG: UDP-N-acetylmuramoyl-L-alanyl-D-glutamate--LD-lysine ligase [Bacteroidetes bacterium ADurb.Bin416]|nr:MAG: UDP-N-acetylmuramoyl-L-alanyl-D-glutamate--LD-lysine ligase [Bacteroidetes bacterium ADurb.Bin416]